ncbi:citramalate synthase [Acetanaerobacterium elongatum]|uniref:Citramalate synthase n=1 Tax=Acetanaerobacterium elongatum TaxID=258515 RepID=A0A1H0FVS6_9FIRM|nr:citramalate synthase [Acetanaerobacterium elongatum]SDN98681.1 2-isopropylmalate synthase [Acetanaerobacterium elongatum]
MKQLEILDTTLRDGAQSEGISFSVSDKLAIVKVLDEFGVTFIEAGNPVSNPKDMEFFDKAADLQLKNARLCAFGSTRRKNTAVEEDENVRSLLSANTPAVSVFGKTWDLHVTEVLRISLEENLAMVSDTVGYLTKNGKEVVFDAEHFFDGYINNPEYALKVLKAAHKAGAAVLCLCDTNGGTGPLEVYTITKEVCRVFEGARVGIHCHNDTGCAVANTILSVQAGAVHVQGTFTGIGERCGNANLSAVIPTLQLKNGYECVNGRLEKLTNAALKISEISNLSLQSNLPYVGASAFAHKGGMHIDGVNKISKSFEHVEPNTVGNKRRFLLSEVAGKNALLAKLEGIAPGIAQQKEQISLILNLLKDKEHEGYQFEAADASFELLVKRALGLFTPHFSLDMYRTSGEYPSPDGETNASAMLKIQVNGETETTAAMGNGPVHALDTALRKALTVFYPQLAQVHLIDYKVRVLEAKQATGATVRVLIESADGSRKWTTVGVSTDIIAASWEALVDSIEYALMRQN